MKMCRTSRRQDRPATGLTAFTLVEILIVVVLLGILAAIALPKFSNASAMARASMLADDLRVMRTQLAVYRGQHCGVSPGYPGGNSSLAASEAAFYAQMSMSSSETGATAAPGTAGFRYGPYLREMPVNPVNAKATIEIIADGAVFPNAADDSHGWIYQAETMILKADSPGNDDNGTLFFDY